MKSLISSKFMQLLRLCRIGGSFTGPSKNGSESQDVKTLPDILNRLQDLSEKLDSQASPDVQQASDEWRFFDAAHEYCRKYGRDSMLWIAFEVIKDKRESAPCLATRH